MYRLRSSRHDQAVPFPTLAAAIHELQHLLQALEVTGARIAFNDRLEYEITERLRADIELMWIEDEAGLPILSEDTTLDC